LYHFLSFAEHKKGILKNVGKETVLVTIDLTLTNKIRKEALGYRYETMMTEFSFLCELSL